METARDFIFLDSKINVDGDCSHEIKRHLLAPWKKSYDKIDSVLKSRNITLPTNVHIVKAMVFSLVTYGYESWTIKKAELCCWRRLFEILLECKEIKLVSSKGNQSSIFIGRTDAQAPILWPPHVKYWLIRKDPDAGKDWRQEEKWMTDEMVGWHHQPTGHEFGQALGDGEGQRSLACCSPWGSKESDPTEWLNNNKSLKQ